MQRSAAERGDNFARGARTPVVRGSRARRSLRHRRTGRASCALSFPGARAATLRTMSSAPAMVPPARTIWLDGALVPWEAARVHVLAQSLARGSLIFDYMSVHETPRGPAIFRLTEHVDRFAASARLVGLPLAQDAATLRAACKAAVRANPGARVVKLNAYLASEEVDVVPADERVSVAALAYDPWADVLLRKQPPPARPPKTVKLWVEKEQRQRRAEILHPHAKVAGNYTHAMIAKWRARRAGYDEIVLLNERDELTETPTANFFLVDASGTLRTAPDAAVLLGDLARRGLALASGSRAPGHLSAGSSAEHAADQPQIAHRGGRAGDTRPARP